MNFQIKLTKKVAIKSSEFIIFVGEKNSKKVFSKHLPAFLVEVVQKMLKENTALVVDKKIVCLNILEQDTFFKVVLVGVGNLKECDDNTLSMAAGDSIRAAQSLNMQTPYLFAIDEIECIYPVALGLVLGSYSFDEYKSDKAKLSIKSIEIFSNDNLAQQVLEEALDMAQNVNFVRDLTNQPANVLNPLKLAQIAQDKAAKNNLKCSVLQQEDMQKLGMQALLSVAKGSLNPPCLIVVEYNGDKKSTEKLALVGKGVTFDSGGISIKPTEGMSEMKDDMSGSAVVLASVFAIAQLKLPINVVAVAACVENMPSGSAYRPGDIIQSALGKSIEIITTDAEGRLVLADAIWYADTVLGATKIIDIATLTGAASIALGDFVSGVVANNQHLCDKVVRSGKITGEICWQMPSFKEFKEYYKSDVADFKNSGGRSGGLITGGMFIGEFTDKPWVHIDIGNTVASKATKGHNVKGPSGFGVRVLVQTAKQLM